MTKSPFHISPPLQTILTALAASFTGQCSYGYASSQELTSSTRQYGFHLQGEI